MTVIMATAIECILYPPTPIKIAASSLRMLYTAKFDLSCSGGVHCKKKCITSPWWLIGDVVAQKDVGVQEDSVAQGGCGGSGECGG
jgi:hypothetical protein